MIPRFVLQTGAVCVISSISWALAAADLQITIDNLRSDKGQVCLCVFSLESSDVKLFPDCKNGRPARSGKAIISGGKAVITYYGLKEGTYAVAIIHDENGNGELDTNFLGIPVEGLGISNNPKLYGKPRFDDGRFDLTGNRAITIDAKYFL